MDCHGVVRPIGRRLPQSEKKAAGRLTCEIQLCMQDCCAVFNGCIPRDVEQRFVNLLQKLNFVTPRFASYWKEDGEIEALCRQNQRLRFRVLPVHAASNGAVLQIERRRLIRPGCLPWCRAVVNQLVTAHNNTGDNDDGAAYENAPTYKLSTFRLPPRLYLATKI